MKRLKIRNRLLELVTDRERQLGRRMRLRDIAKFVGITDTTMTSWIRNEVSRFDTHVVVGLCNYFDIEIGDLLYFEYEEETEEDSEA
jgi:DNA-binding Xre family transcriptional regulator